MLLRTRRFDNLNETVEFCIQKLELFCEICDRRGAFFAVFAWRAVGWSLFFAFEAIATIDRFLSVGTEWHFAFCLALIAGRLESFGRRIERAGSI